MELLTEKNAFIVTIVLCDLLSVLGLVILIPLVLISNATGGGCMLYADSIAYGPDSVCSYPIAISVIFQLVYTVVRAALLFALLNIPTLKTKFPQAIYFTVCPIIDVIACILTLVSGGIISHGFSVMCSELFHPHSDRCGEVDIYNPPTNSFLTDYYTHLSTAEVFLGYFGAGVSYLVCSFQVAVWISWVLWILLILVDVFHLWQTDLLSAFPFSLLPCTERIRAASSQNEADRSGNNQNEADRSGNNQNNITVVYKFRGQNEEIDRPGGAGSRTPPPQRPVPPPPAPRLESVKQETT